MLQRVMNNMKRRAFRGGITFSAALHHKKESAMAAPFMPVQPPVLHVELQEQLQPVVQVGDPVCIGYKLAADPTAFLPPVHSGISGTVTAVEPSTRTVTGEMATVITVTGDGHHTVGDLLPPLPDDAPREALLKRMYDAGLVGLGGAGYPVHRKYAAAHPRFLLINACECEPYLAGDNRLAVEQTQAVVDGVRLLAATAGLPLKHVTLCTESPATAAYFRGAPFAVKQLPGRYPQGSERQLIEATLGIRIPFDAYPAHCGILVSNLATAVAMADAANGLPLTHRPVTVSGEVARPLNVFAPIGTPFSVLIEAAVPLLAGRRCRYIAGGPMTGTRLSNLSAGLPKTCGGITILPALKDESSPCIRCGACVRVCPAALMPFRIEAAFLANEPDSTAAACISCGCCSYVCPAKRELAAHIGKARRQMR